MQGGFFARQLRAWCLVGAAALWLPLLAQAASVDLVVNTATSKPVYSYQELIQHTVTVANRGPGSATNAVLTVVSPQSAQTTAGWNAQVSCTASGGAVCPASYALNAAQDTLTATIPSIPMGGELTLSLPAPIYTNPYQIGPLFEYATSTATVAVNSTDTELIPVTNTAGANYRVNKPRVDYSVTATGPKVEAISGTNNHKVTYQVTVHNNEELNSLLTNFVWYESNGSEAWDSSFNGTYFAHPYQAGYFGLGLIPAIDARCIASTGGATCSTATDVDAGSGYAMYTPNMPSGSSLTFEVSRIVGLPRCIDGTDTGYRSLQLVLIQTGPNLNQSRTPVGLTENSGTTSDNRAYVPPAHITAPRCLNGDLIVNGIVANGGTSDAPYQANQPFEITVTYSNAGAATATNAGLSFSLDLSYYYLSLLTLDLSKTTCIATGNAICPNAADWKPNGTEPQYRNQLSAFAPLMPANSSLKVTFKGTISPNTDKICRKQLITANAKITPPADFKDTNYHPDWLPTYSTDNQTQGNNAYQIRPWVDIGVDCPGLNYDVGTRKTGPYSDSAATQLINTPVKPGDWIYFRSIYTVLPDGVQVKTYDFSDRLDYFNYPIDKTLFDYQSQFQIDGSKYPIGPYSQTISADDPKLMTGRLGDPAGVPTTPKYVDQPYYLPSYNSGVRCVAASGGITCPSSINTSYQGPIPTAPPVRAENAYGWYLGSDNWDNGQPVWSQGGRVEFIYSYRVPPLDPSVTCLRPGQTAGKSYGLNVAREASRGVIDVGERDYQNNWDAVRFEVDPGLKPCPTGSPPTLTKTASASTMPLDGKVTYTVKLSNTSPQAIDVPRLRDTLSPAGVDQGVIATIDRCEPAGTAVCPGYTPLQGRRYTDNGATSTATTRDDSHVAGVARQRPDFDFSWGTPGSDTLPSGTSVTFTITVQYPASVTASTNLATATPDYSAQKVFSRLDASAVVGSPAQPPIIVNKEVSPQQATPGSTVMYTVDLINPHTAAANGLYFSDLLVPGMQGSNPGGYGNLSCAPVTSADGLLPNPVAGATCPVFTSGATGITARVDLPANSGLRLSYTAVAPTPGGYSFDNTAALRYSLTSRTSGDSGAQANYGVPPLLPDLTSDIADIPHANNQAAGSTVTVSVTYNNIGAGAGHDVVPTLQLPPGLSQVVPSNGGIYDSATGLITWPAIGTFAPNAPVTYTVSFTMPSATVPMRSYITGSNEPDTVLANNADTASLSNAAQPTPIPTLSEWSLMALTLLLLGMAQRQRRR